MFKKISTILAVLLFGMMLSGCVSSRGVSDSSKWYWGEWATALNRVGDRKFTGSVADSDKKLIQEKFMDIMAQAELLDHARLTIRKDAIYFDMNPMNPEEKTYNFTTKFKIEESLDEEVKIIFLDGNFKGEHWRLKKGRNLSEMNLGIGPNGLLNMPLDRKTVSPMQLTEANPIYSYVKFMEAIKARNFDEAAKWASVNYLNDFKLDNDSKIENLKYADGLDLKSDIRFFDRGIAGGENTCGIYVVLKCKNGEPANEMLSLLHKDGRWILMKSDEYMKHVLKSK